MYAVDIAVNVYAVDAAAGKISAVIQELLTKISPQSIRLGGDFQMEGVIHGKSIEQKNNI